MTDNLNININQAVEDWAKILIARFKEAMQKDGVQNYTEDLVKSFANELIRNGGDVEKVIFRMRAHGRFVDMGVGRGVPIGSRGTAGFEKSRKSDGKLHQYGRVKKPFYSKTKTREIAILREILVKNYGIKTLAEIENGFTFTDTETII